MEEARKFFKQVRVDTIIRAILLIIMAMMFFINPESAMVSTAIMFSIFILCDGVFSLFVYFFSYGLSGIYGTTLLGSIFKILFGILTLSYPGMTTIMFSIMFAIYVITVSANGIEEAFYFKRIGAHWILPLVLGILSLIGGITMLFMSPGELVSTSGIIAGITLMITAIEDILTVVDMYRVKKSVDSVVVDIK